MSNRSTGLPSNDAVRRGEIDFISGFAIQQLKAIDAGIPMTVLAGLHAGCFELFAQKNIHGIAELKGKSVGLKLSPEDLLTLMAAQVGLDPVKDIHWVTGPSSTRWRFSRKERSMHSSGSRPSRRNCGRGTPAM